MPAFDIPLWCRYMNKGSVVAVMLGSILFAIGFIVKVSHDDVEGKFARFGVKADARVLRKRATKERQPGEGKHMTWGFAFSVDYEFNDITGAVRSGGSRVSEPEFKRINKGDTIRVEYVRDEPESNRILQAQSAFAAPTWLGTAIVGLGAFIGVLGVFGLAYEFLKATRRARVVQYGSPFLGCVDEIDEHPETDGKSKFVLSYSFQDADGDDCDGWIWLPARLRQRWPPGKPILVLWDGRANSYPEPDIYEIRTDEFARLQNEPMPPVTPSRKKKRKKTR